MRTIQNLLMGFKLISITMAVVIIVGCGSRADSQKGNLTKELTLTPGIFQTNSVVRYYKDLPADGVLVQVGDRVLTRDRFQELVDEWMLLNRKSGPRVAEQKEEILQKEGYQYVFANFMARAAMLQEAAVLKIEPNEADLIAAEQYFQKLCRRLRMNRKAFASRFAGGDNFVRQRIHEEAVLRAVVRQKFGKTFEVTEQSVTALREELQRLQKQAIETNTFFKASLSDVRERLVSGKLTIVEDKAAMQQKMPVGVTYSGVQSCAGYQLDESVRKVLDVLKFGEWSNILDQEGTFEIYRVISIEPHSERDLMVYSFILISAPCDLGWVIPSNEKLRKDIEQKRKNDLQAPWTRELIIKFGVLYPNGVELFGTVTSQSKPGQRVPSVQISNKGK